MKIKQGLVVVPDEGPETSSIHENLFTSPQWVSQLALVVKNPPANAGDERHGFNPWVGNPLERGHGNPLQYSCLENPINRGDWWAIVHGVTKSRTLKRLSTHT